MNIDKIKNMTDEELETFLQRITFKKNNNCIKCGSIDTAKVIKIENKDLFQTKKLCNICDKCYKELLEYLNTPDIDWR